MAADPNRHGLTQHPPVGGRGRVIVVQAPIGGIVPVHGIPRRPERRVIRPQVDLPVTHRIERPGLVEGLSRGVLQFFLLFLLYGFACLLITRAEHYIIN